MQKVLLSLLLVLSASGQQHAIAQGAADSSAPSRVSASSLAMNSSLNGVAICPSVSYPDFGVCVNAASSARQVNILDGGGVSTVVVAPPSQQVLHFGVGTYILPGIDVWDSTVGYADSNVIEGVGITGTYLKLADGSNRDLIADTHFSTLSGYTLAGVNKGFGPGKNAFGVRNLIVRNLTLDGNAARNKSGAGIRIYASGALLEHLHIFNTPQMCLWNEHNTITVPADLSFAGSVVFSDIQMDHCGSANATYPDTIDPFDSDADIAASGWVDYGPNDIYVDKITSAANTFGWGIVIGSSVHSDGVDSYRNGFGGCLFVLQGTMFNSDDLCDSGAISGNYGELHLAGGGVQSTSAALGGDYGLDVKVPSSVVTGNIESTKYAAIKIDGGNINYQGTVAFGDPFKNASCYMSMANESYGGSYINLMGTSFASDRNHPDPAQYLFCGANDKMPPNATTNREKQPSRGDFIVSPIPHNSVARYQNDRYYVQFPGNSFRMNGYRHELPNRSDRLVGYDSDRAVPAAGTPALFDANGQLYSPGYASCLSAGTGCPLFSTTAIMTSATSDTFTIAGLPAGYRCALTPSSAIAVATLTILPWIRSVSANTVTVAHDATVLSGKTFTITCQP